MNRIAFISHGHPNSSKGGAEVASWNLHKSLLEHGIESLYIARSGEVKDNRIKRLKTDDDVLFYSSVSDWFNLASENDDILFCELGELLSDFNPDVVHVHHYAHIGIEIFAAIRRALPKAKIVFTIHEFMAICMHNGQMVKKGSFDLCYKAEFSECHKCFPQYAPSDFLLRKSYIQDQFSLIDTFVSPSKFLADRYIDWGIDGRKMNVIENICPSNTSLDPRILKKGEFRSNFAFFGQINPYKGVDLLLDAIALLPSPYKEVIKLDINGANLDVQDSGFQTKIKDSLSKLEKIVALKGSYQAKELPERMQSCDWVVIPSIWWENSPVVIQESIRFGRPLIGSNIGGMKEKIQDIAGLTFEVGNPQSLAEALISAMNPATFDIWHKKLRFNENLVLDHIAFYDEILTQ